MSKPKKVLLAVGGTGGHLFPAQALAHELRLKEDVEILFAGAGLKTNRFLDKTLFRFEEVISATPFKRNPLGACFTLLKGIGSSISLLKKEKPDLVVGFGSYHSFPLLVAAKLLRIPLVLFEADTIPGKVNRLFSRFALFTAIHFPEAQKYLKGKSIPVAMPSRHQQLFDSMTQEEAREHLGLDPRCFTLFVFGGSQGAKGINQKIPALLAQFAASHIPVQLIHMTGNEETSLIMREVCHQLDILHYIKEFDPQMGYLWKASTALIGRAGASTLSEMMAFEVPGILVPYPHASDGHQLINARFIEKDVGAGVSLLEENLTTEGLFTLLQNFDNRLPDFQKKMRTYKNAQKKEKLGKMIYELLVAR